MVVLRSAVRLNSLTGLAVTKLDVLDDLDEIKICTGYQHNGTEIQDFPAEIKILQDCIPIYESHPGWKEDISGITKFDDLPENAKKYLARIEQLCSVRIKIV